MRTRKQKIFAMILPSVLLMIIFIIWVAFQLTLDDMKGQQNFIKNFYYHALTVLPDKPDVKLAVPYHKQEHALSCEIASLLMALQYRGHDITETQLIAQLPISDPSPRRADNTWGDPELGFVGNIDGSMPNTGYGVYEQPIYDLAIKYRNAKILTNATQSELIQELVNGNPIVVWGVSGRGRNIEWKTPGGKIINAKMDEHARTLIGFTGTVDKPVKMILFDPIYGEIRMSTKDFLANWAILQNRAVVIY